MRPARRRDSPSRHPTRFSAARFVRGLAARRVPDKSVLRAAAIPRPAHPARFGSGRFLPDFAPAPLDIRALFYDNGSSNTKGNESMNKLSDYLYALLDYAQDRGLIEDEDRAYTLNRLMEICALDAPEGPRPPRAASPETATPILEPLLELAAAPETFARSRRVPRAKAGARRARA